MNFPGFNLLTCPDRVWFNIRIPKPGFRGSHLSCTDPVVHSVVASTWHRVPSLSSSRSDGAGRVCFLIPFVEVAHHLLPNCGSCSWSCAFVVILCHVLNSVAFRALWMNHLSFLSLQISPCHYYLFVTPLSRHRWHPFTASKNFVPSHGRLSQNKTNMCKRLSPLTRVNCRAKILFPVTDV